MSPLYTEAEQDAILELRRILRSRCEPPREKIWARNSLIALGIHACRRSWRIKAANAKRSGLLAAADISHEQCGACECESAIRRAAGGEK